MRRDSPERDLILNCQETEGRVHVFSLYLERSFLVIIF